MIREASVIAAHVSGSSFRSCASASPTISNWRSTAARSIASLT
jgi:hypothetical protein